MSSFEYQYLDLLRRVLKDGEEREDRTGTGTISLFGERLKFDVKKEGFPLLTTKRVPFKSVLSELLWFMEGSGDERRLAEILHGTRDPSKKTIWSPNVEKTSGSKFTPKYHGDLGRIYGVNWRSWRTPDNSSIYGYTNIDQLKNVIETLKTNPSDRRMIVSAWNVGEIAKNQMALPPCHMMFQFYLTQDRVLHCQMYQRSVDVFLGLPFNCASYSILMYIVAKEIGAEPGTLTMCLGDTHIYSNHIEQVELQLTRKAEMLPKLTIIGDDKRWNRLGMDDFVLESYNPQATISAPMAQ